MRYLLVVVCLLLKLNSNGQEKRLAWVIGNSNYEKGFLKNPVNDALLVAKTLNELNFTVLLDTNIATYRDFCNAVNRYGEQRGNFNIGFIYYAGHGVQINNENYLLATKEEYNDENNVGDYGLSIQRILKYIEDRSSEVNVLILDACRDNPFEKTWKATGRSLEGGRGLAKANPPTGSLIAYSTDAGNIAADGTGKNSIYCLSLIKNMQIENLTLDQVFRNVRTEVLKLSENKQRPVEASQLTGEAFYLKKGTYIDQINIVDSLIKAENYTLALQEVSSILTHDATNKMALCRKGEVLMNLQGENYDGADLFKAIKLFPNDPEPLVYSGRYYYSVDKKDEALSEYGKAIKLDSTYTKSYFSRTTIYEESNQLDKALTDYNKIIELEPNNADYYYFRASFYEDYKQDNQNALSNYSKAIELNPEGITNWYARGSLYTNNLGNNIKALEDFNKVLELDSTDVDAINGIGVIYQKENQLERAIKTYERGISLEKNKPASAAYCYRNRASLYEKQNLLDKALKDYNAAISLDPTNADRYSDRGDFYRDYKEDYTNAQNDYSQAIKLNPQELLFWFRRGHLYKNYLNNNKKALEDFNKALEIDSTEVDAINWIGVIYQEENQLEKAIETYERGISLEKNKPASAAYCYRNRASLYEKQNLLDKALKDYNSAISLDPTNADRYSDRAIYYRDYKKENQRALIDFTKAIELDPNETSNWYARGVLYDDILNNNKKALDDYNKILELDSTNINAINAIGLIYQEENQLEKAMETYNKGVQLEKANPSAAAYCYMNRASIYEKQNLLDKALEDYNKALKLAPNNTEIYIKRGDYYSDKLKDYYNALVDYTMAISLDSLNTYNWSKRATLLSDYLNNHLGAIEDCKHIIKLDSNETVILNWIGVYYDRMGDNDNAINYYNKTISKVNCHFEDSLWQYSNGIAWSYSNLAEEFQEGNKLDSASIYYTLAIKYDSKEPERYLRQGIHNGFYLKNYKNAIEDINMAIKLDSKNPLWYFYKSKLFFESLYEKDVISIISKAIELSDNKSIYLAERGNYYRAFQKYDLAQKDFNEAMNLDSNLASTYQYQILLLKENSQIQEAIKFGEQTISKFKNDTVANYILGEIYLEQKDYLKSLKYFNSALSIMEYDSTFQTQDQEVKMVYLSNTYQKVGEVYQLLGDKELPKEYYAKALIALKDEIRPDKLLKEKELQDIINQ